MKIGRNRVSITQGIRLSKNFYFGGVRGGLQGTGGFGFSSAGLAISPQLGQGNGTFGFSSAAQLPYLAQGNGTFGFSGSGTGTALIDEYLDVINYATGEGYTLPSSAQQVLQNELVISLVSSGIWANLDSFYMYATDGNSDFALIDWVNLTTATAVNSPTFTTNQGYKSNGTTSYLNIMSLSGLTNYTLNDCAIMYGTDSGSGGYVAGVFDGTDLTRFRHVSVYQVGINATSDQNLGSGVDYNARFYIERTSATTVSVYRNNVLLALTASANSSAIPTGQNLFALALNSNGTPTGYHDKNLKYLAVGASLSSGDQSTFDSALDNYLTSI